MHSYTKRLQVEGTAFRQECLDRQKALIATPKDACGNELQNADAYRILGESEATNISCVSCGSEWEFKLIHVWMQSGKAEVRIGLEKRQLPVEDASLRGNLVRGII